MCGACGVKPDWAGPLVAGPLRRRDIARCLNQLVSSVTVAEISRGWIIKKPTGASTPAQTFDDLIQALIPRARYRTWDELEQALLDVPAPVRADDREDTWPFVRSTSSIALPVLTRVQHLPAHMMLSAVALGVSTCEFEGTIIAELGDNMNLTAEPGQLHLHKADTHVHANI